MQNQAEYLNTFNHSFTLLDDYRLLGHDHRMTCRSRPINLFLVLVLLLGTAMPLLHAVAANEGYWTTSCSGRALFVPTTTDEPTEQVRCLICLAELHNEHGHIAAGFKLRLRHFATARLHQSQGAPTAPACPLSPHIRAPPSPLTGG